MVELLGTSFFQSNPLCFVKQHIFLPVGLVENEFSLFRGSAAAL